MDGNIPTFVLLLQQQTILSAVSHFVHYYPFYVHNTSHLVFFNNDVFLTLF